MASSSEVWIREYNEASKHTYDSTRMISERSSFGTGWKHIDIGPPTKNCTLCQCENKLINFDLEKNVQEQRARNKARMKDNDSVADLIHDGRWIWPDEWLRLYPVLNQITIPILSLRKDNDVWIEDQNKEVDFSDMMLVWHQGVDLKSPLCKRCPDSHSHLFFKCPYAAQVWKEVSMKGRFGRDCKTLKSVVINLAAQKSKNNIWHIVNKVIMCETVYFIWIERSKRIFKDESRTVEKLAKNIMKYMNDMLMNL
uniref:Reverse transcriptase zinc-binding domain-containing protein n=1 Tax=Tanacetum cinerariifolium TaxID=118510 RepID=A0A6L2N956_TANCI|nr:hypothetical protein [Tanacetum cinerariifolium]